MQLQPEADLQRRPDGPVLLPHGLDATQAGRERHMPLEEREDLVLFEGHVPLGQHLEAPEDAAGVLPIVRVADVLEIRGTHGFVRGPG